MLALQACISVVVAALNLAYWWMVVRPGQEWFRSWCKRRFEVTIGFTTRGHWRVTGGTSRLRRLAIEWAPLGYYMVAFGVWSVAITVTVLALSLLD